MYIGLRRLSVPNTHMDSDIFSEYQSAPGLARLKSGDAGNLSNQAAMHFTAARECEFII